LGDAAVAGAEVEPKPPRTSNIISLGYDSPKSIERKSDLVAFVEESPIFVIRIIRCHGALKKPDCHQ
jgi:hypothetical protein